VVFGSAGGTGFELGASAVGIVFLDIKPLLVGTPL